MSALFLVWFGLVRLGLLPEPRWMESAAPTRWPWVRARMSHLARSSGSAAQFGLGLLLGFIPCGLSYAAFARSLAASSAVEGALMTAAFGVGTLPGLLLVGAVASGLARRFRRLSDLLSGALMIGMGVVLGSEALGAGI